MARELRSVGPGDGKLSSRKGEWQQIDSKNIYNHYYGIGFGYWMCIKASFSLDCWRVSNPILIVLY